MNSGLEFLKAVLLGIIQGITEWLPISSTGHMILFEHWFPMSFSEDFVNLFIVFIQIGSVLAVILLFFRKLYPWYPSNTPEKRRESLILWTKIAVGSIPAAVLAFLFDDLIDTYLYNPWVISAMLVVYGLLFIYVEKTQTEYHITKLKDLTYKDAILIGVFQTFALIPGTSRSGATIIGALWLGASRLVAAEFSFFLSIPILLGAGGLKLLKAGFGWSGLEWSILILGTLVAFVVSLAVIRFLMNFVKKNTFTVFAYYRIGLAALVILLMVFVK